MMKLMKLVPIFVALSMAACAQTASPEVTASESQAVVAYNDGLQFTDDAGLSDPTNWGDPGTKHAHGSVAFGETNIPDAGMIRVPRVVDQRETIIATVAPNGDTSPLLNLSSSGDGGVVSLELGRQYVDQTLIYGSSNVVLVQTDTSGFGSILFEVEGHGHQLRYTPNVQSGVFNWIWGNEVQYAVTQATARSGAGTHLVFQAGESIDNGGGEVIFRSGYSASGFKSPSVRFEHNTQARADYTLLESCEPALGSHVLALNKGSPMTSSPGSAPGDRVLHISPAATNPSAPPTVGAYLYFDSDAGTLNVWAAGQDASHSL